MISHSAQRLQHHEDPDAVVHGFAHVVGADLFERTVHRHVVPDAHGLLDLFGRHPEVHVELVRFGELLLLAARKVRRFASRL
jgi:hypothetical protein